MWTKKKSKQKGGMCLKKHKVEKEAAGLESKQNPFLWCVAAKMFSSGVMHSIESNWNSSVLAVKHYEAQPKLLKAQDVFTLIQTIKWCVKQLESLSLNPHYLKVQSFPEAF